MYGVAVGGRQGSYLELGLPDNVVVEDEGRVHQSRGELHQICIINAGGNFIRTA